MPIDGKCGRNLYFRSARTKAAAHDEGVGADRTIYELVIQITVRMNVVGSEILPRTVLFPEPVSPNNLSDVVSRTTEVLPLYHVRDKCPVSHAEDERNT